MFTLVQALVAGAWLALVWPIQMQLGSPSRLSPAVAPHQPTLGEMQCLGSNSLAVLIGSSDSLNK